MVWLLLFFVGCSKQASRPGVDQSGESRSERYDMVPEAAEEESPATAQAGVEVVVRGARWDGAKARGAEGQLILELAYHNRSRVPSEIRTVTASILDSGASLCKGRRDLDRRIAPRADLPFVVESPCVWSDITPEHLTIRGYYTFTVGDGEEHQRGFRDLSAIK